jgi:hypothetical protein
MANPLFFKQIVHNFDCFSRRLLENDFYKIDDVSGEKRMKVEIIQWDPFPHPYPLMMYVFSINSSACGIVEKNRQHSKKPKGWITSGSPAPSAWAWEQRIYPPKAVEKAGVIPRHKLITLTIHDLKRFSLFPANLPLNSDDFSTV